MTTHPQHLGKYELHERLGRGGMAEVWKAFDTQLHRYVAIKLLHADLQHDPEFLTRFIREARAIASLHHPNIVQVYDFQTANTSEGESPVAYMVMNYVEGQTLADYIAYTSHLGQFPSPVEIVRLFAALGRAVDYAHKHGVLHRDIKPANILLEKRDTDSSSMGEPILSDFGIVKLIGVATGTAAGMWIGTPLYVSPEQLQGIPGTVLSDIYSLGVVLYEVCTGVRPFAGDTSSSILVQQVTATPIPPEQANPHISPTLAGVIMRCLAKNPADRFQSASALAVAVAQALNVPVPEDLADISSPVRSADGEEMPTILPRNTASAAIEALARETPIPPFDEALFLSAENSTPQAVPQPVAKQSFPETPAKPTPPVPVPSPAPATGGRRKSLLFILIPLALLVILGSVLGGGYWLTHNMHTSPTSTQQLLGYVFFLSTGSIDTQSNNGINDQLQINLKNLTNPAAGKAFYAWLLEDKKVTEPNSILVATFKTIADGTMQTTYTGDADHTNLLASYSRFLITEEDASSTPLTPSLDQKTWRYYAELAQTPNPADNLSLVDHLRHLLAKDPILDSLHLPGGLDIWLLRNTQSVTQQATDARECAQSDNTGCMRRDLIRVLDFLDGPKYVQADVPANTPFLTDPKFTSVALLEFDQQNQNPPGYLYHINKHLQGIINAPGVTPEQKQLATQIDKDINNLSSWLEKVRSDAKQLVSMSDSQLLSQNSLAILNDLENYAGYTSNGQFDPNTNQTMGGVLRIHQNIQRLATFDVTVW